MIFRSRPLPADGHQRPFWLLVALAIMLLVCVSITVAQAASPLRLASTLQRDIGALRVQLEQIDPSRSEGERSSVAFNADLGDGSPAFQRQTMVTVAHAANRRLERLITAYRELGDDERRRSAETLSADMYEVTERVDRLAHATAPATVAALRGEVETALDRLDRGLALLSPRQVVTTTTTGTPARR
jgi:hypothetical protein